MHEEAIHATQVQLCNADVDFEMLKHGTIVIDQLACSVAVAHEGQRMLDLTKKEMFKYLTTGKLMATDWAKSQGCAFDFSGMDLDSTNDLKSQGFNEAVDKV